MVNKIHALLVGINDYPPEVGKLSGCLNDIDDFRAYLETDFAASGLALEVLKDSEATYDNVVRQFRGHLGKAGEGDVALFLYCGHGARWASAKAFKEYYPDGKDEGLVCVDSRLPGGFDLADKELAILISEVAKNGPHVAIMLDCCHSGSGTRGADAFRGLKPRVTHEVTVERPLETYLDGYYANLHRNKEPLVIPTGKHILLAACERTQLAQESADRGGVFTGTALDVLRKSGGDLSYADFFVRCRAAVRTRAQNQDPQFETHGGFNASSGFLGRSASHGGRRFGASFDQGAWKVECGAIHGVPTEAEKIVTLALYPESDQTRLAGTATMVQVGAQKSELKLDFASDELVRYRAEITSLPVPPLLVHFKSTAEEFAIVRDALSSDRSANVTLTDIEESARYALSLEGGDLLLKQPGADLAIQGATIEDGKLKNAAITILPSLRKVEQWERGLSLRNAGTRMDPTLVDFEFAERLPDGDEHAWPAGEIILDYTRSGDKWNQLRGRFKVRNRTRQTLHVVLAYFSTAYGVHILRNEPADAGDAYATVWGENPDDYFYLEDGVNETIENFKLLVTTEKVDDFLLGQDDLVMGQVNRGTRAIGSVRPMNKLVYQNEWFTKDCRIKIVRRLDQVGAKPASLAAGRIVIEGHPTLTANLSLSAARSSARGVSEGADFSAAFEKLGLAMLNFAGTRGDNESVLELTDIQNAAALKDSPLQIQVNVPLAENEGILPLVFDGQHVVLGGDPYKDEDGNTHISIDHIPEATDHRRSLGGSLKLYFFKTWLKKTEVNQLRWVEYKADGLFEYQTSMIANKVAAARNILLLVHGIIGDTEGMAGAIHNLGLDQKFDLVLTYDYENLSTPIEETARHLKAQLTAVGLEEADGKRLTLLVHSMGGLVSRWFIEREGGSAVVDHLVMCGTPNNGSPFGRIDDARKVLDVLTSLSMNYVPVFIPFSSAILLLLNRSRKLTPTLEQMNPASDFMRTLNQSGDPGIPYTILAGDVDAYREPSDQLFARMLAKAGQSFVFEALFASKANDIAVGVDSILDVGGRRSSAPVRRNVACHHLNYFNSTTGREALMAVAW